MFSDVLEKISWDETTQKIASKTDADVVRALAKERLDVDDFMALISPAAVPHLEEMARLSQKYTQERFGKTISMYIPLYLSNACTNFCVYCGFNHNNPFTRTTLNDAQILEECKAIRKLGPFENLLIVTGEAPAVAGVDYLENALHIARPFFNNLSIEVQPLKADDYYRLTKSGLNGVVCFQETYHKARYNVYHPKGMKSIFEWRLNGYDRMGQAGVHKIGMGVLIGLEDWRTDVTMMAHHLRYLQKHYWQTRYSVNFPADAPVGKWIPTKRDDDRQGAGAAHICIPNLRPRRRHLILYAREPAVPRKHDEARCHIDECRKQDRPGRLRRRARLARAVPRQRRAVAESRHQRNPRPRLRACVERLGQNLRLTQQQAHKKAS